MTVSTSMNDGVCGTGLSSCGRPPQVRDAQKLYKLENVGGTQVLHVEGNHCRARFLSPQTNNSKLILLSILLQLYVRPGWYQHDVKRDDCLRNCSRAATKRLHDDVTRDHRHRATYLTLYFYYSIVHMYKRNAVDAAKCCSAVRTLLPNVALTITSICVLRRPAEPRQQLQALPNLASCCRQSSPPSNLPLQSLHFQTPVSKGGPEPTCSYP